MTLLVALALVTFSIFIHEMGHFLVARWRGLFVPRFSLFGLGKPIVSKRWRGVDFCICWLPIGAYVMIPQLSDLGEFEGELPPDAPKHLPPANFTSKVLVALAGPAANLLFAFLLACVVWIVGVDVPLEFNRTEIGEVARELRTTEGKIAPGPAFVAGLQRGDVVVEIDGRSVSTFQEVLWGVMRGGQVSPDGRRVTTVTVERENKRITKQVFPELVTTEGLRVIGIEPRSALVVDRVAPESPAAQAGLAPGDQIIAVDGQVLTRRDELRQHFQKKNTEPSILTYKRGDEDKTTTLKPRLETVQGQTLYLIGITWKFEHIHRTPFAQMGDAVQQIYQTLSSLLDRGSDIRVSHMSGLVGIVDNLQQAASAGIIPMFAFLLVINLSLAIFNLLPIPVLDGGHVAIACWTKLRGHPPNPAWLQKAVAACFLMLIGLIVYVSYHDIRRAVQDRTADTPPPQAKATGDNKTPAPSRSEQAPAPAK